MLGWARVVLSCNRRQAAAATAHPVLPGATPDTAECRPYTPCTPCPLHTTSGFRYHEFMSDADTGPGLLGCGVEKIGIKTTRRLFCRCTEYYTLVPHLSTPP